MVIYNIKFNLLAWNTRLNATSEMKIYRLWTGIISTFFSCFVPAKTIIIPVQNTDPDLVFRIYSNDFTTEQHLYFSVFRSDPRVYWRKPWRPIRWTRNLWNSGPTWTGKPPLWKDSLLGCPITSLKTHLLASSKPSK